MSPPALAAMKPQGARSASGPAEMLLEVEDLTCHLPTPRGTVRAVDGVSFSIPRGRTLGIVGESGSGKSMLVRTLMGIPPRIAETSGSVRFDGTELTDLPAARARTYHGRHIAMVFQDPMTSLNPVVRIDRHLMEAPRHHLGISRSEARARALELLELVGIPEPERRLRQYPHQFSGGMRQRVTIAMALACDPELLIADEATTALDVTVQKQILDLLQRIQRERDMAMIMVSHDLGVMAGRTDEVAVMYAGRVVEQAATATLFDEHGHRYTRALLDAIPRADNPRHGLLRTIQGGPPDPLAMPSGCRFAPRCSAATELCTSKDPAFTEGEAPSHRFACHHPVTEPLGGPR